MTKSAASPKTDLEGWKKFFKIDQNKASLGGRLEDNDKESDKGLWETGQRRWESKGGEDKSTDKNE